MCYYRSYIVSTYFFSGTSYISVWNRRTKREVFEALAEGKYIGAFGLTEPNAGTDAASQQTTAVLQGDYYILNGTKIFITNGGEADIYIIFAMTDKSKGTRGISAFIVEKTIQAFL